jgi:AraC-like DNA-binding protein
MNSRLNDVRDWAELAHNANYGVHEIADRCEVSVRQLERFFRERTGESPHVWVNKVRQERAIAMLKDGFMVKEAAVNLGYKSVAHFSREFKRFHGFPPSRHRLPSAFLPSLPMSHSDNKCRV